MLRLHHQARLEGLERLLGWRLPERLVEKIRGVGEIIARRHRRQPLEVANRAGGETGGPTQNPRRAPPLGVELGVLRLRNVARRNRHHGSELGQRMGAGRYPLQGVQRVFGRVAPAHQLRGPFVQAPRIGHLAEENEVGHLFEARPPDQLLHRVAAVEQSAPDAIDLGDRGVADDEPSEAASVGLLGAHRAVADHRRSRSTTPT